MNHSPAPWSQDPEGEYSCCIEDANGRVIAEVRRMEIEDIFKPIPEAQANLNLIEAAPKLLAALQAVMDYEDGKPAKGTFGYTVYANAKKAIAKATAP